MAEYLSPILFPSATITSGIGPRNAPIAGASTNHAGIDIAAPRGTDVYAPADLTVTYAGVAKGYGNVIYATDNSTLNQYRFAHLDTIGVVPGASIAQGTVIGSVGSTGNSTGNHLHFEVRDKAGKVLKNLANDIVNLGQSKLAEKAKGLISSGLELAGLANPAVGAAQKVASAVGLNPFDDSCGIVCQIKKWFAETEFFQRVAFIVLALVLIVGAIVFFAKDSGIAKQAKAMVK